MRRYSVLIIGNHLVLLADHWRCVYHSIRVSGSRSERRRGDWLLLVQTKSCPCLSIDIPNGTGTTAARSCGAVPAHRFDFILRKDNYFTFSLKIRGKKAAGK